MVSQFTQAMSKSPRFNITRLDGEIPVSIDPERVFCFNENRSFSNSILNMRRISSETLRLKICGVITFNCLFIKILVAVQRSLIRDGRDKPYVINTPFGTNDVMAEEDQVVQISSQEEKGLRRVYARLCDFSQKEKLVQGSIIHGIRKLGTECFYVCAFS